MSNLPKTDSRRKPSSFHLFGIGCGALALILIAICGVVYYRVNADSEKPVNKELVLASLAGVPIYPDAKFDDEETSKGLAALPLLNISHAKLATAVGFRANADTDKEIIPFYDRMMAGLGFQKTRDLNMLGQSGVTYVNGDTKVIVQPQPTDPGEDQLFRIVRFDEERRSILGHDSAVVTSEDWKKTFEQSKHAKTKQEKDK